METPCTRITIQATQKRDALLAARRVRVALEGAGARTVRGEFVRNDGRLYLEVPVGEPLPEQAKLREVAGDVATISQETVDSQSPVDECLNCGNVPESPFTVCPNCSFREITPCPICGGETPRTQYLSAGGSLFQCPISTCHTRVRLAYNEPVWRDDGRYNEPAIVVTVAARRSA